MIYHNIHARVEAEPVSLAGERYYAVALHGKAHLVHGPAFELLYGAEVGARAVQAVDALPVVEREKSARKASEKPKRKLASQNVAVSATPVCAGRKVSPQQQRVLDVLSTGPLTHAELASEVYSDLDRKTACMNLYPLTAAMREKGLIVKRADPEAGDIPKWFRV